MHKVPKHQRPAAGADGEARSSRCTHIHKDDRLARWGVPENLTRRRLTNFIGAVTWKWANDRIPYAGNLEVQNVMPLVAVDDTPLDGQSIDQNTGHAVVGQQHTHQQPPPLR